MLLSQYVEFTGLDEDGDDIPDQVNGREHGLRLPNPNADKANVQQGKSLEALLATKNKRILEELTKFRVRHYYRKLNRLCQAEPLQVLHGELEASLQATEVQLISAKSDLEKQTVLNEKLEIDLLSMNKHKENGDVAPSEPGGLDVLASLDFGKKSAVNVSSQTSHDTFLIMLVLQDLSARTTPIPFTSSADTSILPIVTSQRDRFRQRNAELEDVCLLLEFR